ncbi:3'-5' exonuclease [[Clostridium] colinum]|uniref:3'-5' exonuclease n=1 Tax=[Clostridium] colinum TaxID=36835 RepID=UPI0020255A9E|nr:3'-5' exonuclease [[Clostridium] colinum]
MSSYQNKKYYDFKGLEEYDLNKCLRLPLNEYVVVDIETTGLTPSSEIIEVCALHIIDGNVVDKYSSLIDYPDRKSLPKKITELTGITLDMMREDGGYVEDVLQNLKNFIGDKPICCHNAKFDLNFLKDKLGKYINTNINNDFIDTLYISREFLSDKLSNHKLPTIAKYFNIDTTNLHRAEGDCMVTYNIYEKLKEFLEPEFENQTINYEDFQKENKPPSCSKILILGLCLIFFTPITLSYLVWKHVNGGKPIKIVIIILIWFIAFMMFSTSSFVEVSK